MNAFRYGFLGLPLALTIVPSVVFLPKFYFDQFGISLALIGLVLFVVRLIDSVMDLYFGFTLGSSKFQGRASFWLWIGGLGLVLSFVALYAPHLLISNESPALAAFWFAVFSLGTYVAYSFISILYQALATRSRSAGTWVPMREALGVFGTLVGAVLIYDLTVRYPLYGSAVYGLCFALLVLVGLLLLPWSQMQNAQTVNPSHNVGAESRPASGSWWSRLTGWRVYTSLGAATLLSHLAFAIAASLVAFFVENWLGAKDQMPLFLGSYFLAAVVGVPVWKLIARQIGVLSGWLVSGAASVAIFIWCLGLQPGDATAYLWICVLSGLCFGSELILPQVYGLEMVKKQSLSVTEFYGFWNFLIKMSATLSVSISFPLLQWAGFKADDTTTFGAIPWVYAALPCALKIVSLLWILRLKRGLGEVRSV